MKKNSIEIMGILNNSLLKDPYYSLLFFLVLAFFLALLIVSFSYFLARQNTELEKLSAYECGFEPYEDTRHKFDISFCLIGVLFILFDIEIMFLIP